MEDLLKKIRTLLPKGVSDGKIIAFADETYASDDNPQKQKLFEVFVHKKTRRQFDASKTPVRVEEVLSDLLKFIPKKLAKKGKAIYVFEDGSFSQKNDLTKKLSFKAVLYDTKSREKAFKTVIDDTKAGEKEPVFIMPKSVRGVEVGHLFLKSGKFAKKANFDEVLGIVAGIKNKNARPGKRLFMVYPQIVQDYFCSKSVDIELNSSDAGKENTKKIMELQNGEMSNYNFSAVRSCYNNPDLGKGVGFLPSKMGLEDYVLKNFDAINAALQSITPTDVANYMYQKKTDTAKDGRKFRLSYCDHFVSSSVTETKDVIGAGKSEIWCCGKTTRKKSSMSTSDWTICCFWI